jgi:hypothetical protein
MQDALGSHIRKIRPPPCLPQQHFFLLAIIVKKARLKFESFQIKYFKDFQ